MRRIVLLVGLIILSAGLARAQIAVYVTSSTARLSNVATGDVLSGGSYHEQNANFWATGIGGGVTFNFLPLGPVKLGFDLRGSTRPGTVGADTAFAGVKLGISPPVIPLKPYIQASGGYVGTRTVNVSTVVNGGSSGTIGGTFTNRYVAWEILGGLDYWLARFVDLRLIEVGGGTGTSVLGTSGAPNISLFTINSGVVLHF